MSSSALSVLPPTTNILNPQQRTRLMRSTKKLGAVLGATPYLLENDASFAILPLGKATSRALKRQGSLFAHRHPSSSSVASSVVSVTPTPRHTPSPSICTLPEGTTPAEQSSDSAPANPPGLSTCRKRGLRAKPPQLCLQLSTVPVSPTDGRLALPHSPLASPSLPPTPVTPAPPDIAEIRRKRMAKLARHLGEKVPAELVFASELAPPPPLPPKHCPGRLTRRRTQSAHVLRTQAVSLVRQDWVGEWNRPNIRDVQSELRNLRVG